MPVLFCVCDDDVTTPPGPTIEEVLARVVPAL
jgi:hypothetical protein